MTFNELLQEVFEITNRPDLDSLTTSCIKNATLKAHASDFYFRDLYENEIKFKESCYKQSVDLYQLFCNFRSLKYFKRYDINDSPEAGKFLDIITPEETLDSYNRNRVDVCYQAGRMLQILSSVNFNCAIVGAYMIPIVTPTGSYSSWVAQLQPTFIIFEAARVLFKTIGYDEQSAQYNTLVKEEFKLLTTTGLANQAH